VKVLDELQPRVVLPMHYPSHMILEAFLQLVRDRYLIKENAKPSTVISTEDLPAKPEVLVLPGGF
jgi:L-ascorbate metabolism protein UlaG (beta-lactamase superfamily)